MEIEKKYAGFHDLVMRECKAKDFHLKKKLSGKSGDEVYLCDITIESPTYSGFAIIKYTTNHPEYAKNEYDAHNLAAQSLPEFAKQHIPKLIKNVDGDNQSAFIMTIAGSGLGLTEELASVDHSTQTAVMLDVSELLLTHWLKENVGEECTAQNLLVDWLDYRVGNDSTLPELLERQLSIRAETESFYFVGRAFPNPFYHATHCNSPLAGVQLRPLVGYMHGDLHGHNCLYGGLDNGTKRSFLIDFEQFKDNKPMFFDQAYLEFSLLINNYSGITTNEWLKIISLLDDIDESDEFGGTGLTGDMYSRIEQIHTYRRYIRTWATEHYEGRIEDIYAQMILSRIAVGLNFANKGRLDSDETISNRMKVFSFMYAASNLDYLFNRRRVTWPEPKAIAMETFAESIDEQEIVEILWEDFDYFSNNFAKFVFLAGEKLRSINSLEAQTLTSLPWNLILDFDSERDGIHDKSKQSLSESVAWKHYLPEQITKGLETDVLIWLSVNGYQPDSSSIYGNFKQWRREVVSKLRVLSEEFSRHTSVLPVNLLVVAGEEEEKKVQHVLETMDESLEDKLKVIVLCSSDSELATFQKLGEHLELDIQCIKCSPSNFITSIARYRSVPAVDEKVLIPMRDLVNKQLLKVEVPKELLAASSKCINILHNGLANKKTNIGQFHKGHQISWPEVDQNLAIDLSIDSKAKDYAVAALNKNSYEKLTIHHQPGSGGSTIIRKVAWRLKNDWPVLEVTNNSKNIHEYVEKISNLANLPILIIVDGPVLSSNEKDRLINELRVRGVMHLLLESERSSYKSEKRSSSALSVPCPLNSNDASALYHCYKGLANTSRKAALESLAYDPSMNIYRQPFFFGFFTFEEEFNSVDSFVNNSIKGLHEDRKRLLLWISFITCYTQEKMPMTFLNIILGRASTSAFRVKEVFGDSASHLFLVEDVSVRIIHPVIAQKIIYELLDKRNLITYSNRLQDACVELIDTLGNPKLCNEEQTEKILQGLFISRKIEMNQDHEGKAKFSALMNEIDSSNKQHKVLKHLCEKFPDNAHYLSHFGRHINYDRDRDSNEAIEYFERAIEIEPDSEVHYHGLAMVYSNLVYATTRDVRANKILHDGKRVRAIDLIDRIQNDYELSRKYFMKALDISWKSEHALVSYTRLIQVALEAIYWQSKPDNTIRDEYKYCDFLKQSSVASRWCREALEELEWSVEELKRLQDEDKISGYAEETISRVPKFYDDKDGLIEGLTNLLTSQADIEHSNTRRLLAATYFKVHESSRLSDKKLHKIVDLMEDNIAGIKGNDRDIKYWFRAYRLLPNFSYYEAIDRIETWERLRKSAQATYYLYILHYFSYKQGVQNSQQKAKDYIEKCKRNIPVSTTSKKSFEWVSSDTKLALPLVSSHELGKWDGFFKNTNKLARVKGVISSVESHPKGTIRVDGFSAHFVPKNKFTTDDVNTEVSFYLGFSFEGLKAWQVERV